MDDMTRRDDLLRVVHRHLVHREFADRFTPSGANDGRTIVVALPEDTIHNLCTRVRSAGGAANVVTTVFDGLLVFTMTVHAPGEASDYVPSDVSAEKTVAEVVLRLMNEGGSASFMVCGANESSHVDSPRVLQIA